MEMWRCNEGDICPCYITLLWCGPAVLVVGDGGEGDGSVARDTPAFVTLRCCDVAMQSSLSGVASLRRVVVMWPCSPCCDSSGVVEREMAVEQGGYTPALIMLWCRDMAVQSSSLGVMERGGYIPAIVTLCCVVVIWPAIVVDREEWHAMKVEIVVVVFNSLLRVEKAVF